MVVGISLTQKLGHGRETSAALTNGATSPEPSPTRNCLAAGNTGGIVPRVIPGNV